MIFIRFRYNENLYQKRIAIIYKIIQNLRIRRSIHI